MIQRQWAWTSPPLNHETVGEVLIEKVRARYEEKEKMFGAQTLRWLERHILLDVVDGQWKDHLLTLDHLKEGIGLRGYGQKDPLVEFKKEAFILFDDLMNRIDTEAVRFLFLVRPAEQPVTATASASTITSTSTSTKGPRRREAFRSFRRKKSNASKDASNNKCNFRRDQRPLRLQSRCVPPQKSAATIPAPAVPERNTRSATANQPKSRITFSDRERLPKIPPTATAL